MGVLEEVRPMWESARSANCSGEGHEDDEAPQGAGGHEEERALEEMAYCALGAGRESHDLAMSISHDWIDRLSCALSHELRSLSGTFVL